jgi:hypothetical protein
MGGFREVATHTVRDAIPSERRREGMQVYTVNDATTWQLQGGITNSNWVVSGGGGSGGGSSIAEIAFSYGDATPRTIHTTVDTRRVWQVLLAIDVPFNGASPSLAVGDAGDADRLMAATQNDPLTIGVYATQPAHEYASGTAITLTIVPGSGASAGSGKIQLFF